MTRADMRAAAPGALPMQVETAPDARMGMERVRVEQEKLPVYAGPYAVTPSGESQRLQTAGMHLTGDVDVAPVPADYPFDLKPVLLRPGGRIQFGADVVHRRVVIIRILSPHRGPAAGTIPGGSPFIS